MVIMNNEIVAINAKSFVIVLCLMRAFRVLHKLQATFNGLAKAGK